MVSRTNEETRRDWGVEVTDLGSTGSVVWSEGRLRGALVPVQPRHHRGSTVADQRVCTSARQLELTGGQVQFADTNLLQVDSRKTIGEDRSPKY